jgi:hypothetical protein
MNWTQKRLVELKCRACWHGITHRYYVRVCDAINYLENRLRR